MKKLLLIPALMAFCCALHAQNFPALTGTTLEGKTINIPQQTNGKYTLLGLTYSQKSQEALSQWAQEIYDYFITDPAYDFNIYLVPMIGGVKGVAAGAVEKEMKKSLDPELYKYFLLYVGEVASYKQSLKMGDKDVPYFFVLDKTGKIVYRTSGAYSDDKLEKIDEAIEADE